MTRSTLILILSLLPISAFAEDSFPAPFGLSWDMTLSDLKAAGFSHSSTEGGLDLYSSVSVPKAWSKGESYVAIVYKGRLVKLSAISVDFTDDIYGTEGKGVYNQMKSMLIKKYGQPSNEFERVGLSLYDESDEFYQCLDYSGCGFYSTVFNFMDGTIGLQLKGLRRGEGYLTIGYESPSFAIALDEIKRGNESADADSF